MTRAPDLTCRQVGIIAANQCRYIFWHRSSIEYLFVKEPYLATVMSTMIARDITNKLYCMNHKVREWWVILYEPQDD